MGFLGLTWNYTIHVNNESSKNQTSVLENICLNFVG